MLDLIKYTLDGRTETDHLRAPLFSMKGSYDGPRLVATGPDALIKGLADRFWNVPELSNMRGSLVLRTNDQDPSFDLPDAIVEFSETSENEAYFQILGRMTGLGMIAGRGVPQRWVA